MSRRCRTWLWRYRWLVVAACLAAATWIVVSQVRPPPPPTVPVLVTAHELPAGSVLTADDIEVVAAASAPEGMVSADSAIGSTLAVGLPAGVPVVTTMLVGPGLADAAPPGWGTVPVPLADPLLAELVRVGDRIDLYLAAADTGGRLSEAELISTQAIVLSRPVEAESSASWLGTSPSSRATTIVVAVHGEDAAALTGASGFGPFRAVLSAG